MEERLEQTIDAKNESLGRLAAKIAVLLRGKDKTDFAPYKDIGDFVVVKNIAQLKFTGSKFKNKIYYRHTGYLGGLKEATMKEVYIKKGPEELLKMAVYGMLPKNKLRSKQIKRLKFDKE